MLWNLPGGRRGNNKGACGGTDVAKMWETYLQG